MVVKGFGNGPRLLSIMEMAEKEVVLIIYLKSGLRDKTSLLTYRTGFVALLAQLYGSEIVDSTIFCIVKQLQVSTVVTIATELSGA